MTRSAKLRTRTRIRETGSDLAFTILNTAVLIVATAAILYPLLHVVSASFSSGDAVMSGRVKIWPVGFTLTAYRKVFEYQQIWVGFKNSVFYAVVGTTVNVTMTIIAAYPLSRRDLSGKNIIISLFLFSLMFDGGLIPTYLLVKQVGLLNTRWALIIPQALSVWSLLIAIAFFRSSIPEELLEAAHLDGASDFHYFFAIALPLSTPLIAVLALYYAVGHWNQFFAALIYLGRADLYPLQLILRQILVQNQLDQSMLGDVQEMARRQELRELIKYAVIVIASAPVMVLYPFVQRYFVKGMTLGAVKG